MDVESGFRNGGAGDKERGGDGEVSGVHDDGVQC